MIPILDKNQKSEGMCPRKQQINGRVRMKASAPEPML